MDDDSSAQSLSVPPSIAKWKLTNPIEPAPQDERDQKDHLSWRIRGRAVGDLVSNTRLKLAWRESDKILMKSFLAYYRQSPSQLRCLAEIDKRTDAQSLDPTTATAAGQPSLRKLAQHMCIDIDALSRAKAWPCFSKKMVSAMTYTLKQAVNNRLLREVFDQERWTSVLDWPNEVRGAWIHPAWTGDTSTTLEPDEPDELDEGAPQSEDRDAGRSDDQNTSQSQDRLQVGVDTMSNNRTRQHHHP
ncbi:uncharacterized protein LY79DRAFT_674536 [Colletotrichum navitas]|uniref:Uncharacterized protein n=1 Tax=Colletotrichum navitas TaxID=681940 RepID=A0AAD8PLR9_9PEZI|nr:uncharacterized protein LY79DRAFT_674536 [Colletotrichum navitas]KAK1569649.1 hypothetical protein LY79DRAFT_674536 [Colletotrichum navitas]